MGSPRRPQEAERTAWLDAEPDTSPRIDATARRQAPVEPADLAAATPAGPEPSAAFGVQLDYVKIGPDGCANAYVWHGECIAKLGPGGNE